MNALAKALLGIAAAAALLVAVPLAAVSQSQPSDSLSSTGAALAAAAAPYTPLLFGMDSASIAAETAAGVKPDYGTFWIGPWTLTSGWGGPDAQLASMRDAGVTPAIHFYYWGDDISASCLEYGCWSSLHNAQKDRAHWQTLADQLVAHLDSKMQGKPVLVFLETEFNKGNVATYEPLDGYLAEKADQIHAGYPNAQVVMALGNWGQSAWPTWDRTAAASDFVGVQGMRGSTRQSATDAMTLYEKTLEGARTAKADFGKPVVVQDFAFSTYPEPDWLALQRDEIQQFFDSRDELRAAGVEALIYRSWKDAPNMDTRNWYGEAERHFGLAWSDGALKPAGQAWIDGVKAERTPPPPPNQPPAAAFASSMDLLTVSVDASASSDPDGDALSYAWTFGDGATAVGKTASHAYAGAGPYVVGLTVSDGEATASASQTVQAIQPNRAPAAAFSASTSLLTVALDGADSSDPDGDLLGYAWSFGDGTTGTGKTVSHTYAKGGTYTVTLTVGDGRLSAQVSRAVTVTAPTSTSTSSSAAPYSASFSVRSASNEWWQQVKVSASPAPSKVQLSVNGGAWQTMKLQSYGDWTSSVHVTKGSSVTFKATAPDGRTATSAPMSWLGTATTTGTTATATTTTAKATSTASFTASFTPKAVGNDWWVETAVSGNQPIAKVEAKVNSGSWVTLSHQDWGTWAKSINAPNGSQVTFRATSSTGATATSTPVTWT